MGKYSIKQVRAALADSALEFDDEFESMTDDELAKQSFADLGLDSLDTVLLYEKLDDETKLSIPEDKWWDCRTIQDVLNL